MIDHLKTAQAHLDKAAHHLKMAERIVMVGGGITLALLLVSLFCFIMAATHLR